MQNNNPHAYVNPPLGGGACKDCGRPPEHSLHTYVLPGLEDFVKEREAKQGQTVQQTFLFGKRLATLTAEQEKVWEQTFAFYVDSEGYDDYQAGQATWSDLQSQFPELRTFDGCTA